MTSEQVLITNCINNDKQSQYKLYDLYAPRMESVCRRYAKSACDAEDILQEGFIKVFRYLGDFKNNGSFEGWMRRIMVTTAFNFYKRKKILSTESELNSFPDSVVTEQEAIGEIFHKELVQMVMELPNGYRKVFSLNTMEGYTHKEIGKMLNISINTSKSQLTRARLSLQKRLNRENAYVLDRGKILQTA